MSSRMRHGRTPDRSEFSKALLDIVPLSLGVAVYGLAFGLLAAGEGMGAWSTGLMGALVFAGSAQIVALERLSTDSGPLLAVVAGLALNLRILLMTASLRNDLDGRPAWQIVLGVHLTSDENWVLMHATRNSGTPAGYWYLVGGGTSLITVWVVATAIGAGFAQALPELGDSGLDFAFAAAFILLLTSLWRGPQSLSPWIVSVAIAGAFALLLPFDPSWGLLAGAIAGAGFAGWCRRE
ncbi:AzlC family ABC transporter permease [Profundibacterium mesophilum]|uniref:Branched-chain amino acid permease n=1 Tax=Profundibacterium mesophilum KAUST100406-0324 TaxID=1037889 RepID=A0A921NUA7_9RHOB|nr:AzlC family ABC transporter permease [Profundibacterium mesophilum]KAF0674904.1 Branched-chain amino acid permease [Profundibacterium mesophilum KAUST100406-0324]